MAERPFSEILPTLSGGEIDNDMGDQLRDLVEACIGTGKAGTLTLAVEVKPNGTERVTVASKLTLKAPGPTREASLFYVTGDFDLTRRRPNQRTLDDLMPEEGDK